MEMCKFRTWYLLLIISLRVSTGVTCLELYACFRLTLLGTVLSQDQNTVFGQSGEFTIL